MTLATGSLASCGAHRRMSSASVTDLPRTRSMTRRAFVGEMRTNRAFATAVGNVSTEVISCYLCSSRKRSSHALCSSRKRSSQALCSSRKRSSPLSLPVVLDVTLERAGRCELAELVPDHRLGDEHRDVLAAVVHRERMPDGVGDDGRPTRPGLDDLLAVLLVLDVDLLEQMVVDERTLLEAAWHRLLLPVLLAGAPASDDELVARFVGLAGAALGLTPRADRVTAAGGLALAAAVRVVDRVHHDTTDGGALALPPHTAGLTPVDVGLLGVTHLANRGAAAHVDAADLTGRHTHGGVGAFLTEQLDARAGP